MNGLKRCILSGEVSMGIAWGGIRWMMHALVWTMPCMARIPFVPVMGYRLPAYWNAPFEGKIDPFLIRRFDPCHDPYTWTARPPCCRVSSVDAYAGTTTPPPKDMGTRTHPCVTDVVCQKPFYKDKNNVCNRDYRCAIGDDVTWDADNDRYVCTDAAMQRWDQMRSDQNYTSLEKMYCT